MSLICPTVTAFDEYQYNQQIKLLKPFAQRIHIDLMDGVFAPTTSPGLDHVWWPHELQADIHLMYQEPMTVVDQLIALKPRLVVVHNEAYVHHMEFAARLHQHDILVGLAILHDTPIEYAYQIMHSFDHVLVFSGHLGHHGGQADLGLLDKVAKIRAHHPDAEIGWDGGVTESNAPLLLHGGVDVLNVGSAIHAADDPASAYATLEAMTRDN